MAGRLEWAAAAVLMAFGVIGLAIAMRTYPGIDADWQAYRATADRLLAGGPLYPPLQLEPYGLGEVARGGGYVYPPSSLPMLPFAIAAWPWRLLNLAVLLAGTWAAARRPLAVGLVLAFPGTWATFANGNAMPLVVGAYGFAYGSRAGWWTVFATALKLWPATLLVLAWRRREPLLWPSVAIAAIGALAVLGGYVPVLLNAEPICQGWPVMSLSCAVTPIVGYVAAAVLVGLACVVASERVAFAALCLSPFVMAPDWTWPYCLLPVMAVMPWLRSPRWSADTVSAPQRLAILGS